MASITTIQNGRSHVSGQLSESYANIVFEKDIEDAKRDRDFVSLEESKEGDKRTFVAKFFNGWDSWSVYEILDPSDNNKYCRC